MPQRQIKMRIYRDGRIEAEIDGIPGAGCMKYIALVEQLTGGETIDSQRTANYFLNDVLDQQRTDTEAERLKGTL